MSCFGCTKKYGLFCKEYGCPNCGYSYCAKCLKRPIAVPRQGGKILNVCLICFDKLSKLQAIANEKVIDCESLPGTLVSKAFVSDQSKKDTSNSSGADILFDDNIPTELGDILAPISPGKEIGAAGTTTSTHSDADDSTEITENLDYIISKRLQGLKAHDESMPTDGDIRERLANLSGMPQKDYSKKDLLLSTDQRTPQEKIHELLEQFMGEASIDQRIQTERTDAISEIERRLQALRDAPVEGESTDVMKKSTDTNTPSDNEQDDETVLKSIMEKYLAEARLPGAPSELESELSASLPAPPPGTKPNDLEELPWCNICNEDAVYRCKGCDGELFCAQCFRECHDDDEEYREHVKEKYSAPPKFKEDHF